jgi:hypothetical protein
MRVGVRALLLAILALLGPPALARAQTTQTASRPVFSIGGRYDGTIREGVEFGLIVPTDSVPPDDFILRYVEGIKVVASGGQSGARVAVGRAFLLKLAKGGSIGGLELLGSTVRTLRGPRDASPHSTYLGAEAGFLLLGAHASVGLAQRVMGPSGPHATILTWSVGVQADW